MRAYAESISPESGTTDRKSGNSGWTYFTVDNTAPDATKQRITSASYPQNYWGAAANKPGTFQVNTATDAAGVAYALDTGAIPSLTDDTCNYNTNTTSTTGLRPVTNGAATFTPPAGLSSGRHTLSLRTFDHAHNVAGTTTTYVFYVSPTFAGNSGENLIEAEAGIPIKDGAGTYAYTEAWGASGGRLSRLVANGPGHSFTYTVSAPITAYYALGALLETNSHFGVVKFRLDGEDLLDPNGEPITVDTYSTSRNSKYQRLGGVRLTAGTHRLSVITVATSSPTPWFYNGWYGVEQVAISNYSDQGYTTGVDAFTIAPIREHTFGSLQGAFNNKGIGTDGSSSADLNMTKENLSLSKTALINQGMTQGGTLTVQQSGQFSGPVTFDIPAPATSGMDNAVASGQSIDLKQADGTYPKPVSSDWENPGYINLLVASTCGPTIARPSRGLSIEVTTNGSTMTSEPMITTLPDWRTTASADLGGLGGSVATDYILNGTTALTGQTGTLYVMKFPITAEWDESTNWWSTELRSVTLPRVGTDFTETCATTALHVFAMNITAN